MHDHTTELDGLYVAISEARTQAKRLKLPFVAYLLDLAGAAVRQAESDS